MSSVPLSTNIQPQPYYESNSPRSVIDIDGTLYRPAHWDATINGHGATNEATVVLTISKNPDFSLKLFKDASVGSPDTPSYIKIWAGFPADVGSGNLSTAGLSLRFSGIISTYDPAWGENIVSFKCRSLAAPLIDNRITGNVLGMTAPQFAQAIAARYGLQFDSTLDQGVKPITVQEMLAAQFVGGANFNGVLYNQHPWDILLQCGAFDGADVWDDPQGILHYSSPSAISRNILDVIWGQDIGLKGASGSHALQLNSNIRVEVRTYQRATRTSTVARVDTGFASGITQVSSTKTTTSSPVFGTPDVVSQSISATGQVTSTLSSTSGGKFSTSTTPASESGKEIYKIFKPNLSPQRATQLAQALWRTYSMQEYSQKFTMPVTKKFLGSFFITTLMQISGFPYQLFNDKYWPRRIVETFEPASRGWTWDIDAVNHMLPLGAV